MSKKIELIMPKMGESIAEATVLKWLKSPGDTVELDEPILEIATDKVDSDVPSPVNGVIKEVLCEVDDVVEVGKAVAIIETDDEVDADIPVVGEDGADSSPAAPADSGQESEAPAEEVPLMKEAQSLMEKPQSDRFYSPLVMNIARTEGVTMDELERIPGTGKDGRVTKKDMLQYVENRGSAPQPQAQPQPQQAPAQPQASVSDPAQAAAPPKEVNVPMFEGDEIIEMDRMRKMISEHMVRSKHTSPHVTSFVEADMTNIVNWRNRIKKSFQEKEGEKITFTPIFVEAVVKAMRDFPMVNISVAGDKIIKRKNINIGMAAALPNGNLIVPVIKKADELNLLGLTKRVNDLAGRAKENKLKPDDTQGGTFTLTNVGTFGNLMGTPVINQPQVAILATGAIVKKPAVVETPQGDLIAVRHKMYLSLSYDHRVVDGMLGGSFLRKVADYLEAFDPNRDI